MTETQEVLDPQRPRRRVGVFLLALVPLAVAGTAGFAAAEYLPAPEQTAAALSPESPVTAPAAEPSAAAAPVAVPVADAVVASSTVSPSAHIQTPQVNVSKAPEPSPEPTPEETQAPAPASASAPAQSSGSTERAAEPSEPSAPAAPKEEPKAEPKPEPKPEPKTPSYTDYCSSPSSPYSSGGSLQGLMSAANKERARLGIAPLSWSGSLASAAQSWSQHMADTKTLAHNPNRPGAENVAGSKSNAALSESVGISNAHSGWMYSYGHCANVMNPAYSTMGAGVARSADGTAVYTTANYR